MRQPVLSVCLAPTCTIRQQFGRRDHGTQGTFWALNQSPSTMMFLFETV